MSTMKEKKIGIYEIIIRATSLEWVVRKMYSAEELLKLRSENEMKHAEEI